jgi:hypothetical protein
MLDGSAPSIRGLQSHPTSIGGMSLTDRTVISCPDTQHQISNTAIEKPHVFVGHIAW